MRLTRDLFHLRWDNALEPIGTLRPGEQAVVELQDASGGQLTPGSAEADVGAIDFGRVNPVTGPIAVEGAEPGDALVVSLRAIEVGDWGWTANIPGFGLLADEFPDPRLAVSAVGGGVVELPFGARLPVLPMVGTLGVALPEPGRHPLVPPSRYGGNLDVRQLTAGASICLPVGVEGALLSLGDAHAAMGDGEVCGTGVEVAATVTIEVALEKGAAPRFPRLSSVPTACRSGPAIVTTGVGPDLMEASREATREMVGELARRCGLRRVDAYLLASVAADLKISELVDAPNWVVSLHLEQAVLDSLGRSRRG